MSNERVETVAELEAWARLAAPDSKWFPYRSRDGFYLVHNGIYLPLSQELFRRVYAAWNKSRAVPVTRTPLAILALLDADAAARVRQAQGEQAR